MSANRTRLLFADDTDLLARARNGIVNRPEFDVMMVASTDEALQLADSSTPGAVVLPAMGEIDGIQICKRVKSSPQGRGVPVLLALPSDGSSKRDACFAAGADDVIFAPVDAADIAQRLDRNASPFRGAPRADVELIVRLASPNGNAVIDATGSQISREAILVSLPAGMSPPAAGILVRAVFTLYEGGTLQVWARVAPGPDPAKTILRFVGLTEAERKAIDYFVDFYLKRAGISETANGASPEELILSASVPSAPPASPAPAAPSAPATPTPTSSGAGSAATADTVRKLGETNLEALADWITQVAAGRDASPLPGFDAGRVKNSVSRLPAAEVSALRGTSMYNSLLVTLRQSAAAKVLLAELTAAFREGGKKLDKRTSEQTGLGAIAQAQQVHNALEQALNEMIKAGNTAAMRDLTPVKTGLLSACVDLKATLDRDVLEKEPAQAPRPKTPARSGIHEGIAKDLVRHSKDKDPSKDDYVPPPAKDTGGPAPRGRGKMIALLVVLFVGAVWSNLDFLLPQAPKPFRPEFAEFETNGIRIWVTQKEAATNTVRYVVDGTWEDADEAARAAAVEDLVARSAAFKRVLVLHYKGQTLAERER